MRYLIQTGGTYLFNTLARPYATEGSVGEIDSD